MAESRTHALNPTAASILGFLATFGPMTGWDVNQFVTATIGNFWNVTPSQVYRELRALADAGLVAQGAPGRRDRVPYTITDAGREAFGTWIRLDPGPDLIRHRLLLTVFFSDHLERGRLIEILDDQRRKHRSALDAYKAMRPGLTEGPMAETLRFGIAYEEMVLSWIEGLEAPRPDG